MMLYNMVTASTDYVTTHRCSSVGIDLKELVEVRCQFKMFEIFAQGLKF